MVNRPVTLVLAAVVLAIEGLTVLALGGYVAVETIIGSPSDVTGSVIVAASGLLAGAALLWVAWGVLHAARWSRAPGVVTQIFALPVGVSLVQSAQYLPGAVLIVGALAGLVALLSPSTTRAMIKD